MKMMARKSIAESGEDPPPAALVVMTFILSTRHLISATLSDVRVA